MPRFEDTRSIMDPDYKKKGIVESELRGAAQGLSMGAADELTGAALAGKDLITGDAGGIIENYKKNRDASRAEYSASQQDNPNAFKVGDAIGTGASFLIPGLNAIKGAKGAAALGAASGIARSEGDLTEGELGKVAKDAAVGASIGGFGRAALDKAMPRFAELAKKMGTPAEKAAQAEGSIPLSKYVSQEDFRRAINPEIAEMQMTGKVAPALKKSASELDAKMAEDARQEYLKRIAEDQGLPIDQVSDMYKTTDEMTRKLRAG